MPQTRLVLSAPTAQARRAYSVLEAAFEDDGFPLAFAETDEVRGIAAVELYAEGDADAIAGRVAAVLDAAGIALPIEREALPDIDWVSKSLDGLKPVRAGRFVVHGAHDRAVVRPNDIAIEIEAGLAFGTGHHGTTAGCLEMLGRVIAARRPRAALDLGAGSAVLAIAIARLAHVPVLATDIDAVAVRVAAGNVRLNRATEVRAIRAVGLAHPVIAARAPYDLIVANILARPLMQLAPRMAAHLAPGGSLILSGILARQRSAVVAAYAGQRFRHVRTLRRGEWVTILFRR